MPLSPHPWSSRDQVLEALRDVHREAVNALNVRSDELNVTYRRWVADAEHRLRPLLRPEDFERLILTPRSLAIQTMGGMNEPLIRNELQARGPALQEVITDLENQERRWTGGVLVVPDTNLFLHAAKIKEIDYRGTIEQRDQPIRLVLPMVVLDELDHLKQSRDPHIRWRARHTLSVIDNALGNSDRGELVPADFSSLKSGSGSIPRGQVTIEVLLEPRGHRRLPIADDEIIDTALTIQYGAGRAVHAITFDTGFATRARLAGLVVTKLVERLGEEPSRG